MDPVSLGLAGAGVVSSLFGGWKAGKERRKMDKQIKGWEAENNAYYKANAFGDYTQRADAQNALRQMREQLDRQTQRQANTQAVTGGTIEQTAAMQEQANKSLADATANIGAAGEQYKQRVTDQYLNRKNQIGMMQYGNTSAAATGWENLMQTGLNTAGTALGSINSIAKKDKQ